MPQDQWAFMDKGLYKERRLHWWAPQSLATHLHKASQASEHELVPIGDRAQEGWNSYEMISKTLGDLNLQTKK